MKKRTQTSTYSIIHEMTASPTQPMPVEKRTHQLSKMWEGLSALEVAPEPTNDDWRMCSDAVNLMETLIRHNTGHWLDCAGDVVQVQDTNNLLHDAVTALAMAGKRKLEGKSLRLDARGIVAVRSILEDYAAMIETLPARTMVKVHRLTEKRIQEIMRGKKMPHDVEVI